MQVLVITDGIGALTSAQAGRVLAEGWPGSTVVPAGGAGAGFGRAYADLIGAELITGMAGATPAWWAARDGVVAAGLEVARPADDQGIPYQGSTLALGEVTATALRAQPRPRRLVIDCAAGALAHDGGAGLLAGLGATADVPLDGGVAGLDGIGSVALAPVRELVGDAEVIGVIPADQAGQQLLGLRGITSVRRGSAVDPERLLRTDATLERWAGLLGVADRAGAGACGGAALAVLALGGRLVAGPELALESVPERRLDLVVTGCGVFDFAERGGEVVAAAARVAERSLCPAVVIAGEVLIGGREMRTLGIESAYPVRASAADAPVTDGIEPDELSAVVRRVARSWRW
ncbi:glycerate kinase [Microlunatus parietis]|uniref:Glycerate kinase n=1 Tax=Microlunatus parietis TaxID=682979 RepID=A0A7Y9I5U9_9ACTN|nr:glycerate kinase [Microlunatus parietis]NYE70833.1 glycerate kinase [Microlunatus parietis]